MPTDAETITKLDGPALSRLAWQLGLAPTEVVSIGQHALVMATGRHLRAWAPHWDLEAASAVFRQLRAREYTTSCVWYGDDRRYGEAWCAANGHRAWAVQWPHEASTEAFALLLVSVLAVASMEEEA